MSNIIKSIDDLKPVIDIMNYVNKNNIDFDIIKETLELFIKKDENNNNLNNNQFAGSNSIFGFGSNNENNNNNNLFGNFGF